MMGGKRAMLGAVLAAGLASGCAMGPDYVRPGMETPASYKEIGDWKMAEPNDHAVRGAWWLVFSDPDLNALIEQVEVSNQNLKVAEARYRQAAALTQSSRAALLPTISTNASSTRSRAAARGGPVQDIGTNHTASVGASWEIDLWGRIRRQLESSNASAEASAADLESARLSLQSALAVNYFQLRVSDAQKQMFEETVAAYERSLELTRNRYNVGVAAKADVVQAEAQLKSTVAQAIDLGVQRAQLEHAIAVLVGKSPSSFSLAEKRLNVVMPKIPLGLPSELLERRPDIAAAERRAAAANAQIGVATAAYFPSLSLSGSEGYSSSTLSKWLSAPNRFWSLGPSAALTLLDFGRRGAATDQAAAGYDQAVAAYRQAVLDGMQEVEDNLATLRILEREAVVQDEAVRAARESVLLTTNQYKAGTVSYLSVVTVQASLLANERTQVSLLGRRLSASVGLIQALGGGWVAGARSGDARSGGN
jgi:NodT family efflux transporter outer membrane factor (OMF) lipoprotein